VPTTQASVQAATAVMAAGRETHPRSSGSQTAVLPAARLLAARPFWLLLLAAAAPLAPGQLIAAPKGAGEPPAADAGRVLKHVLQPAKTCCAMTLPVPVCRRPDAAAAAFAGLQHRQQGLSALSRGHFAGGGAQLRGSGSGGNSTHSLGGSSRTLQARSFGSVGCSCMSWVSDSSRRVPPAVAPAAVRQRQPFAAVICRLLGRNSSSCQVQAQQPAWRPLDRQSAWSRRPVGGGGSRQLLALAACAQRWVQRPLIRW
jgi:hypothetical protein